MGYTTDDAVMHFELTHGRTACGRRLPTRGFTTDDMGILESREGTRCKSCWRVVRADRTATEREFDSPAARARREQADVLSTYTARPDGAIARKLEGI